MALIRYARTSVPGLVLLAAIILAAALPAGAAFPGDTGRLAFAVPSGGNQIVSVKPNGKGERELTAGSRGSSSDPSYSPSGAQIVFVSSRDGASDDIYVMDADGRNVTRVTDTADRDEETPGFSADGDSIFFAADGQIRSIGVDGSGERRIVRGEQPAVSSDGKTIAFVRDKDVFTIGVDGDGKRNLTKDLREGSGSDVGFLSPSFSPDAKWIVLNSNLDAPRNDEFNDDLYLLKANGKRLERLTNGGIEEFNATFSPTGLQIAYVGDTERGARKDGIYVIDADGSNASQLFKVKRPGPPTWQPTEP